MLGLSGVILLQEELFKVVIVHFHLSSLLSNIGTVEGTHVGLILLSLLDQSCLLDLCKLLFAHFLKICSLHSTWKLGTALRLELTVHATQPTSIDDVFVEVVACMRSHMSVHSSCSFLALIFGHYLSRVTLGFEVAFLTLAGLHLGLCFHSLSLLSTTNQLVYSCTTAR